MSNLPGNPYADALADYADPRNGLESIATLALAYEQGTANLIATQALGVTDMTDWAPEHAAMWHARAVEVAVRLGFDGAK